MAVSKLWAVNSRLGQVIDYAANPEKTAVDIYSEEQYQALADVLSYAKDEEKTEREYFVEGINCNPTTARDQFVSVKQAYGKEDGIQAYHGYLSFKEQNITPELAQKIGMEFANEVWGKRFQVVVTTHLNTKHLHCHYVINSVDRYDKVPNNNARLDRVMAHTFKDNAELLLWVPPARPYYQPQGVFKNVSDFSKTLVFSSWEMVPRMIAGLLSYEAERKTVGKLAKANEDKEAHYFYTGEKRYPSARLNFSVSNGTPNAMTLFCLMYPSQFLSRCYDPIDCINRGLTLREIEKEIKGKIADKLVKYETTTSGVQDKRWYYIAPLLLDGAGYVTTWLNSDSELTSYDDEDEKTKRQKGFLTHLQALKELYYETDYGRKCNLGKKPDDLLDVLTDMAIASPAIVINRTYQTYCKKGESFPSFLPSQIAKIFINRMNTAESTATVELACGKKSDDAHWQNLLTYCKQGNLQAMFDEYAHLITNGFDADNNLVGNLHHSIATSMDVRTTIYTVDTFNSFKARANGGKEKATALRSHFAVAFTKGDGKEKDADRKKVIRNAFNSPFRPFVLASTSIGQEGLDFHNYCRRIVHWNLPSNPIDLEQREGRINRFECLAIRQNIAKRYGTVSFKKNIWKEMFDEAAKVENGGEGSDLIPFWGLTEKEDMVRIERIVPMYPFSRDESVKEQYRQMIAQADEGMQQKENKEQEI